MSSLVDNIILMNWAVDVRAQAGGSPEKRQALGVLWILREGHMSRERVWITLVLHPDVPALVASVVINPRLLTGLVQQATELDTDGTETVRHAARTDRT